MSGGSFDWLYRMDDDELLARPQLLQRMADALREIGAEVAASDTEALIEFMALFRDKIAERAAVLGDVWETMEHARSFDSTEDEARKAARRYAEQRNAAGALGAWLRSV